MIENFLIIVGLVLGLGAVTVIDIHGFLGRRSNYWTEATTRTHKVTKPLIWIGMCLYAIGAILKYSKDQNIFLIPVIAASTILVLNGLFLSFTVSKHLIKREQEGRASELLDPAIQFKIQVSFILSFTLWWSQVLIFVYSIS